MIRRTVGLVCLLKVGEEWVFFDRLSVLGRRFHLKEKQKLPTTSELLGEQTGRPKAIGPTVVFTLGGNLTSDR